MSPRTAASDNKLRCQTSVTAKDSIHVDVDTAKTPMSGTITIDGVTLGTRRFTVHAAPHAATYALVFDGYAAGDQKPSRET